MSVRNKFLFLIVTCIICILLCSCRKEDNIIVPEGELSIKKESNGLVTVINDREIESFNTDSKELIFSELTIKDLKRRINDIDTLLFFIGDEMMFSSISIVAGSSDAIFNYLSLVLDDSKCYLLDGYPSLYTLGANVEKCKVQRETNAQRIKMKWDIFVEYLQRRGKIIK